MITGGQQLHVKTHLGHLLNIGDTALGFDFANANVNDENLDQIKPENLPDVVKWTTFKIILMIHLNKRVLFIDFS